LQEKIQKESNEVCKMSRIFLKTNRKKKVLLLSEKSLEKDGIYGENL